MLELTPLGEKALLSHSHSPELINSHDQHADLPALFTPSPHSQTRLSTFLTPSPLDSAWLVMSRRSRPP